MTRVRKTVAFREWLTTLFRRRRWWSRRRHHARHAPLPRQGRPEGIGAEPLEIRLAFSGTQIIDAADGALFGDHAGSPPPAIWQVVAGNELLSSAGRGSLAAAFGLGADLLQTQAAEASFPAKLAETFAIRDDAAAGLIAQEIAAGTFTIDVELVGGEVLGQALAGYAAEGPGGGEVIFVNADWLNAGPSAAWITSVLVEEVGHAIDQRVTAGGDTPGDEGEAFAAAMFQVAFSPQGTARIAAEDDRRLISVRGEVVAIEQASITIQQVYEGTPSALSEEANQLASVVLLSGSSFSFVSADPTAPYFDGNNVSGNLTFTDGGQQQSLYGVVSRLFKTGSTVEGMYFYTSGDDGIIGTGDANESAYAFVMNPAYFTAGGSYRTSSDPVDTALNSFINPNSAPVAVNDLLEVPEDTTGTGNVLTNDSDPDNNQLEVVSYTIGGASGTLGTPTVLAGVGSFTLSADGSFSFTPETNYTGPVPTVSYTISDGDGGTSSATLSLVMVAANDPPETTDDSVTTLVDRPITLQVTDFGSYSDPDSDLLAGIEVTSLESAGSLEFYNGSAWTDVTVNQTVTTAEINSGLLRFSPTAGETGSPYTTIQFTVSDGSLSSLAAATLTVNVLEQNTPPTGADDLAAPNAVESGYLEVGSNATGNVLANDTDADEAVDPGVTHTVITAVSPAASTNLTSVSAGTTSTSSPATIVGVYGTLYLGADGSYVYEVDDTNAVVDALRTASDTLSETFTYAFEDAVGGRGFAALTVVIEGRNDAPVAVDDEDSAKAAGPTDPAINAEGNVLDNDTDVDAGDTKAIVGLLATATGSTVGSSTTTSSFTTSSGFTSVKDGWYIWYRTGDSEPYVYNNPLLDGGGTQLTVVNPQSGSFSFSAEPASPIPTGTYLYFTSSTTAPTGSNSDKYAIIETTTTSSPEGTETSLLSIDGHVVVGMTVTGANVTANTTVAGVAYDANGTVTSITFSQNAAITNQSLTFTAAAGDTVEGRYGNLTLVANGSYVYTPTLTGLEAGNQAIDAFSYEMEDASNVTDTANLTITIDGTSADGEVLASPDTDTVPEDGSTTGDVLANDNGANTVDGFSWGGTGGSLGTPMTIAGVGNFTLWANGSYAFEPAENYTGLVPHVTYTASNTTDGSNATSTSSLTLTITPVNDPPVSTDDSITTAEDTNVTLAATDFGVYSDLEGDPLTKIQITSLETSGSLEYFNGSAWVDVTLNQEVAVGDLANGSLRFVPGADESGSPYTTLQFRVHDGTDYSLSNQTLTVHVTPVNDPPVNTVPGTQTLFDYESLTFSSANGNAISVADVDGNVTSVQLTTGAGTLAVSASGSAVVTGTGAAGSPLVISGTQSDIAATLAAITYTASSGFVGGDTLRIVTTDGEGLTDADTVPITVNADNRLLAVTGTRVNEASPYLPFQVDGQAGQLVELTLAATGSGAGYAVIGTDVSPNIEYYNGTAWVSYSGGTVAIPGSSGNASLLVRVAVFQDTQFEGVESLNLTATNSAGAAAADSGEIVDNGTGDIFLAANPTFTANTSGQPGYPDYLDDDREITINDISVNEDSQYAVFTVTAGDGQVLALSLANGTATVGTDTGSSLDFYNGSGWEPYNGTSVVMNGTTLFVRTTINDDAIFEGRETFALTAESLGGGKTDLGIGSIYDDGTGQTYNGSIVGNLPATGSGTDDDRVISIDSLTVNEGSNHAIFTLTGTKGQSVELTLLDDSAGGTIAGKADINETQVLQFWDGDNWTDYNTSSLPALVDYTDSGQVNGALLVRVDITAEQDVSYEGSETFRLTGTFADAGPTATGTGTIVDDGTGTTYNATVTNGTPGATTGTDDDRPVAVSNVTVAEDAGYAVFNVTGNVGQVVDLATSNGTATAGADFSAALQYSTDNGSNWLNYTAAVAIPAGGDLQVRVPITDDSDVESSETFTLLATNTGGTTFSGTGTITDNEIVSNATFDVDDVTVNEGAGTLTFTVTKNGVSSVNSTVDFTTVDGTANTADYTALSGTLDFAPSDTSKKVTVNITNDGVYEGSENFSLVLSNAANASIADNTGIGTILDDGTGNNGTNDDRPTFSIDDVTVNEGAGTLTFTVSKSGNTTLPSTVDFATADGTANTADYTATSGTLTFAAGDTSKTVTVNITNDGIYEGSENFSLVLSNAANATIADTTGIGTIVDDGSNGGPDDDRPAFSIDDVTVNEGAGTLTFTVTKTGNTTLPSTVDFAATDGTANTADYTATNGTLVFAAGDTSKTVTVNITNDGIYEGSENFSLVLSNAANAAIADNTGIGTILDDGTGNNGSNDDRPAFSIDDVTVNEGAGTLTFTVSKSGNTTLPSTVDFATTDGTAKTSDYTATNGTLTFAAGDTSKTVTVNITNDDIYEGSENFSLVLSNAANAMIADGTGIGTILDDGTGNNGTNDDRPAFSIDDVAVNEGAGTLTFTVSKSGNTTLPSTVDFATTDGTANAADYTSANGTLTFAAGDTSKTVTVAITNDGIYEGSENFSLVLSNAANATIADNIGIGTILDDGTGNNGTNDDRPAFSIDDVTVNEGAGTLTFTVTKTGNTTLPSTVDFATSDGTANTADYTATNGTLTFAAGDTSKTVTINITDDGIYEGSEDFILVLSDAANATIADNTGIGTILDDGTGNNGTNDDRPAFSINDVTVNEGAGTLTFTVTKTDNTTLPSSVDFATTDGTANAADYTATNGTLTFAAGDSSKTVTVNITNDGIYEGSENFSLVLSNAANATIADNTGIGTIVDDGTGSGGSNDDRPAFGIDDVTVNEGAGTLSFTVTKTGDTTLASTVDFTTADGTANTADYTATNGTLTFAAGETSKSVTLSIANDGIYEGSENFSLVLSNAANATIADNTGIGTILDDGTGSGGTNDDRPAFGIDDVAVNEGAGTLTFTVTKTGNTTLPSSVDFATTDGTANAADYTATNGTLTFAAGDTSKTVTVAITNDGIYEGSENFSLVLTNAANATIADNTGIGTILDDGTGNNGTNDDRPAFSVDDVTVNEGAGTLTFTVSKTGDTTLASTVDFTTADGTANAADYTATNGTLTFAAGDTSKTVTVAITNDSVYEGSENFTLALSNAANATIADNTGIGTIVDDGTGSGGSNDDRPAFSIDDVTVNEGAGTLTFTVSKSGNTTLSSTVDFSTSDGTANTADYTAINGTLTFAAGDMSKTVTVNITNDDIYEGSETFSLVLSNAASATIADNAGIGTILDDGTGPGGTDDDRDPVAVDDALNVTLGGVTSAHIILRNDVHRTGDVLAIAGVDNVAFGNLAVSTDATYPKADGWRSVDLEHGTLYLRGDGQSHYQHHGRAFTVTPQAFEGVLEYQQAGGGWSVVDTAFEITLEEMEDGRLRYTPAGGEVGMEGLVVASIEEIDTTSESFVYTVTDGVHQSDQAVVTYAVGDPDNLLDSPLGQGSDIDYDGIASHVEATLASRVVGVSGLDGGRTYLIDLANVLSVDGFAGEVFRVSAYQDGDLNIDGEPDAEQNAVTTFAWINSENFEAANSDPNSLPSLAPIVNLVAEESSNSFRQPHELVQLENILSTPLTAQQDELLDPMFDFAPSWSPLGFSARPLEGTNLAGLTAIDVDPVRDGVQWRFSLDISRTNESTDSFVAFMKWIDQATIDRYADAGLELRDLDGAIITDVGWHDFTQRVPGGDGVAIGTDGAQVLYLDYTITDNAFGDSNPVEGLVDDPGIPIFINYLNDNRPIVVSSPTVNESVPYAEFTVGGAPKQLLQLSLVDGTAEGGGTDYGAGVGSGLEYSSDGGVTWSLYASGNVVIPATGSLLIRTPLTQDGIPDDGETFQLSVETTGGSVFTGTATIVDDGKAEDDRSTAYEQGGDLNPMPWRTAIGNVLANDDNTRGGTVTAIRTGGVEGQGAAGVVGTTLQGQYGVLNIRSHGAYSYTLDNNNPLVDQLPEGGRLVEQFNYTMTNGEWSDIAVITIDIIGANDSPILLESEISLGEVPVNTGVTEAPEGPVGVVVSTVLTDVGEAANVSDVDLGTSVGFAITGIDQTDGTWWYSEDDGVNWARMAPVSEAAPRLLTSTARVYFRPDRNVTGEIPVGFTFRAWDQSRGVAGQTASVGSLGDALSVIQAAAGLNIAMPGTTLLAYGNDSSLVSLRQAAPAGDIAVRNEHVAPVVIESVTPGARVITLGTGPVDIVAPQGDVTIGRGGTGVLTVTDVPVGAMVSLETSFGVVTFDHTGRLLTGLTPHQLLTLSRITELTVGANGALFRVSGTV